MPWREPITRWGAVAGALLAVATLLRTVWHGAWAWLVTPWWSREVLARFDALSGEIGVLSEAIRDLQRAIVTDTGVPLRASLADHLAEADRRLRDTEARVRDTDRRIDGLIRKDS